MDVYETAARVVKDREVIPPHLRPLHLVQLVDGGADTAELFRRAAADVEDGVQQPVPRGKATRGGGTGREATRGGATRGKATRAEATRGERNGNTGDQGVIYTPTRLKAQPNERMYERTSACKGQAVSIHSFGCIA